MEDTVDFSLPITVVAPEELEEVATTTPFQRQSLPAVGLGRAMRPDPGPPPSRTRLRFGETFAADLHQQATEILPRRGALPPAPRVHASPLSDDDEKRAARRARALRKQSWARNMLRRFQFEPAG